MMCEQDCEEPCKVYFGEDVVVEKNRYTSYLIQIFSRYSYYTNVNK